MAYTPGQGSAGTSGDAGEPRDDASADATRITFNEDTASWIAASPAASATRASTPEEEAAARERVDAELGGADRPTTVMAGTGTRVMPRSEREAAASVHRRSTQSGDRDAERQQTRAQASVDPTVLQPHVDVQPDGTEAAPRTRRRKTDESAGSTESFKGAARSRGEHKRGHRALSFLGKTIRFLLKLVLKAVVFVAVLAVIAAVGLALLSSVAPDLEASLQEQAIELLEGLAEGAAEDAGEAADEPSDAVDAGTSGGSGASSSGADGASSGSGTGSGASSGSDGSSSSDSSGASSSPSSGDGASSGASDQGSSSSPGIEDSSSDADSSGSPSSSEPSSSDPSASIDASSSGGSAGDAAAGATAE